VVTPAWKDLYEKLRVLRKHIAYQNGMQWGWLNNKLLREIARRRPGNLSSFQRIPGIKPRHVKFAERFIKAIREYCHRNGLETDIIPRKMTVDREKLRATRQRIRATVGSMRGVDIGLFRRLMRLRMTLCVGFCARSRIFHNFAIRDMARQRPSTKEGLLKVYGVGHKKCDQYGDIFLKEIKDYCKRKCVDMDVNVAWDNKSYKEKFKQ